MTLGDTGPLVALADSNDRFHERCLTALPDLASPLVVTWPCLTEAMYLLDRAGGFPAQAALWRLFERGIASLHVAGEQERPRIRDLMTQFRDVPMDLADASVVTAAETLNLQTVFTLDRHFYAYRMHGNIAFRIVPG